MTANGLVLAVLASAQRGDGVLVVRAAGEVEAADALHRDDPPRGERGRGGDRVVLRVAERQLARRRRSPSQARGPQAGQAFGCAWKRRSDGSSYSRRQSAHIAKRGHRRARAVVRDAGDDREARAAVGAVGERVAVAPVGGVAQLGQAALAGRGVRGHRRVRRPAAGAAAG